MHNIICAYAQIKLSKNNTLPKTNKAPKNRPSQRETSLPTTIFQGVYTSLKGSTHRMPYTEWYKCAPGWNLL